MTDHDDETAVELSDGRRRRRRVPRGHKPPPGWYGWTMKLGLLVVALLATTAYTFNTIAAKQNADAAKRNADAALAQAEALKALAVSNRVEKRQDACYDLYTQRVVDGNAGALAANTAGDVLERKLFVALAAQPRDEQLVQSLIAEIDKANPAGEAAVTAYDKANADRAAYNAAGRPLPCPLPK